MELGPDGVALVRIDGGQLSPGPAACLVDARRGDGDRLAFIERLRAAKSASRLPVRSSVVLWQRREGLAAHETRLDPALAPLVAAGFEIDEVLSPADALARVVTLAGVDTARGATVAVALHSKGGVIAIVSRAAVVTSHEFEWPLGSPSPRSGSELLDRYIIASQLAPILQHFIELTRAVYDVEPLSACLCGTLPNLRSLSMLLIEELDLEVETLDSSARLGSSLPESLGSAAAFQLAAAAPAPAGVPRGDAPAGASAARSGPSLQPISTVGAMLLAVLWSTLQVAGSSPVTPFPAAPSAVIVGRPGGLPRAQPLQPEATMGRVDTPAATAPAVELPPVIVGTTAPPPRRAGRPVSPILPSVDGVMIAGDRRLAILGGSTFAPGDLVGGRTVAAIDREGVVLREPSGRELRLAIRPRKAPPAGTIIKPQP